MKRLIASTLLAAAFVAVSSFVNGQDAKQADKKNDAVVPVPRDSKNWPERHQKFVERAKEGNVDVLFLGDSITQGWEGNGKEAWKKTFEPLNAANFGIGGDRTQHVLWRITEGKELVGIDPKVAVIMIGTNNSGSNTPEEIADGVKAIVAELRRAKPQVKILLLAVFPRKGKDPKDPLKVTLAEQQPKIKAVNDIIAKLDDGQRVFYLDIGSKFLDNDGNLPKVIMPDFLHLSAKGYDIWAAAIEGKVKDLLK